MNERVDCCIERRGENFGPIIWRRSNLQISMSIIKQNMFDVWYD